MKLALALKAAVEVVVAAVVAVMAAAVEVVVAAEVAAAAVVAIAEIVAADSGIGYVIMSARRYVKTDEVMAGILAIGVIGLATDQAIRWLHRRWFAYLT